jgi:hypothetical protein
MNNDQEVLDGIAAQIEEEWKLGGFSGSIYQEFGNEMAKRFHELKSRPAGQPRSMEIEDREDWQYEVANGDTVLGLAEWIEHKREAGE